MSIVDQTDIGCRSATSADKSVWPHASGQWEIKADRSSSTTNAIKFTGTEEHRTITVTIGASMQRPSDRRDAPVKYFATRKNSQDLLLENDWGKGEKVYIHFSVRDTGRGLSPEEKKLLFMRFSQASPRTHVQYGGSGLGLFISRELTELQGGEIGVESEAGCGSTFAFYVAARRSSPPQDDIDGAVGIKRTPSQAHNPRSKSVPSAVLPQGAPVHVAEGKGEFQADDIKPVVKKVLIVEDNLVNQVGAQPNCSDNCLHFAASCGTCRH